MNRPILFSIGAILLGILVYLSFVFDIPYSTKIRDFYSCVSSGGEVLESFPRQCRSRSGDMYREVIATADLSHLIRVEKPVALATVASPVSFSGTARGVWYFEGSFAVIARDSDGRELGVGIATANNDWMTTDFVPFSGSVKMSPPTTATGTLEFRKENPSGDPALDLSLQIPVKFADVTSSPGCIVTGCSGEICSDSEMASTCEFRPENACYAKARCERQQSGLCGWVKTAEYRSCINNL